MMNSYCINEYLGLVLTIGEVYDLLGLTEEEIAINGDGDIMDMLDEKLNTLGGQVGCCNLMMEYYRIMPDGDCVLMDDDEEGIYYILQANEIPHTNFFKPAYKSYERLKKELVDNYAGRLPDNFDFDSHIGFIREVNEY